MLHELDSLATTTTALRYPHRSHIFTSSKLSFELLSLITGPQPLPLDERLCLSESQTNADRKREGGRETGH